MPWFPDWRRGSKDDVAAYDRAVEALWDNSEREHRAGIRGETDEFHRLNGQVNDLESRLSPVQRSLTAHDLRQARAKRRERRGRKGRSR